MRRGFKAWCERTANGYRQTLGVAPCGPLNPRLLADHLGVRVATPEDITTLSDTARRQLVKVDPDSWSAVTIARDDVRLVILNSGHSEARQRSSLAHELAHLILNHATDRTQLSNEGLLFRGAFDREQEDEATWLGGCLLVPRDGLLQARLRTSDEHALAAKFAVSTDLIAWRLRMTGVLRQLGGRQPAPGFSPAAAPKRPDRRMPARNRRDGPREQKRPDSR